MASRAAVTNQHDHHGRGDHAALRASRSSSSSSNESMADESSTPEVRPFVCTFPGCSRSFKRKYTLKDHIKSHTGEKPFDCPVSSCGKRFTTSGNLARHKRVQHPWLDTALECLIDGCDCTFPNEEKLERHMMTHFDESDEYRCEIGNCGRVFTTTGNLRRHIRQNHIDDTASPLLATQHPPEHLQPLQFAGGDDLPEDHEILDALSCLFDEDAGEEHKRMSF